MKNSSLIVVACVLFILILSSSCNGDKKNNKIHNSEYFIDDFNDTIARRIDWSNVVTKFKYGSKDKEILDKIREHMLLSYEVMFYTQDTYDLLCKISKDEYEKCPKVYRSNFDFWKKYEDYLLNFCYCVYDNRYLKEKDYYFVEEAEDKLFYIDDIRVRDCENTLLGYYPYIGKKEYVFWTDKELNKDQIERVIYTIKPSIYEKEVEFESLDDKGKPNGRYASALCYKTIGGYNFTHFQYRNAKYQYSFDPNNVKYNKVHKGMTMDECRRLWGNSFEVIFRRDGTILWKYSMEKYLIFENGKLKNHSSNDDDIITEN